MTGPSVYNADACNRYPCDDDILADAPENPVRFLSKSELAWKGMVDGIDDLDRLEAYRQAEKRHIKRNSSKAKVDVHKYLDDRERELRGESITAEPTPETTPATATDGGTVETAADSGKPSHDLTTTAESDEATSSPSDSASDSIDDVHPDVRGLEAGQVLEIERADGMVYIFPAQPDADEPYLYRSFDSEGDERTAEPIGLSYSEVRSRREDENPVPIDSIDVRAPKLAASNGGDSE